MLRISYKKDVEEGVKSKIKKSQGLDPQLIKAMERQILLDHNARVAKKKAQKQ